MRLIMRIPSLYFVILVSVAFVECMMITGSINVKHPPAMLAGENTPVWIADRPDPSKPVIYTKLEKWIVKSALDYWQTKKSSDGFPIRLLRMFQHNFVSDPVPHKRPDLEHRSVPVAGNLSENGTETLLLYPSLLVVVDYDYFLPMTKENEETRIKERILYALSFWSSVAIDLHHIERPHLDLRIVGLVITRNRKASPYINNSEYYYSLVSSLQPMLDYWAQDANNNQGVPLETYDIVAHMTDSHPHREEGFKIYPGIASTSNPCTVSKGISGLIVYDDLAFLGLHTAVETMTNIFGDNSVSWKQYTYDRKGWTPTTLSNIRNGLKYADCMAAPKDYFPPGKKVFPPLPGDLLPRAKQCEAHGFSNHTYHCWSPDFWGLITSTCRDLKCSNSFASITCSYSNPTLDGTFCSFDNKKICMAGECLWAA